MQTTMQLKLETKGKQSSTVVALCFNYFTRKLFNNQQRLVHVLIICDVVSSMKTQTLQHKLRKNAVEQTATR
jgi:hypothetical protein